MTTARTRRNALICDLQSGREFTPEYVASLARFFHCDIATLEQEIEDVIQTADRRAYYQEYYNRPENHNRRVVRTANNVCRRTGVPGVFTLEEWEALCDQHGNRCLFCQAQVPLSPDHIIPRSRGGNNTIQNIQPLCWPCNLKKQNKVLS